MSPSTMAKERAAWLRNAPLVKSESCSLAIVSELASQIAADQDCRQPAAFEERAIDNEALEKPHRSWLASAPREALDSNVLGEVWEQLMHPRTKRTRGSHFTPRFVAEQVVGIGLEHLAVGEGPPAVLDPSVGGGAFLLAAAAALEGRGHSRAAIVAKLSGADIDANVLVVADAALELWAGGAGRPRLVCVDMLGPKPDPFDTREFELVVGNPPFLSQLSSDTARSQTRRADLQERFGAAGAGYVDDSALFLLAAAGVLVDGGVAAMIVPQSTLGLSDSRAVRGKLATEVDLVSLWIESGDLFAAAVDVVAPVFVRRPPSSKTTVIGPGERRRTVATPPPDSWSPLLAASEGVPDIQLTTDSRFAAATTVGDFATVTAGFRQHFYEIADAVTEEGSQSNVALREPRLVTAGAIDPLWLRWGTGPIKFAGRRWLRPVLDLDAIKDDAVRDWFEQRCRPKILVATQTRVVELVVDVAGTLVPSVPVISIEPYDPAHLWGLASFLLSPKVSAHIARQGSGTGLSSDSIRVRAAALAELPIDEAEMNSGFGGAVGAAERAQACSAIEDWIGYRRALETFGDSLAHKDGPDRLARDWWWNRLRFPDS